MAIGRSLDRLALLAVIALLACGGWLARETLGPTTEMAAAGERVRAVQTLAALIGPDGLVADLRAAAIDPGHARGRFERNLATARRAVAVLRSRPAAGADPALDAIETTLARAELAARSGSATLATDRAAAALRSLDATGQPAAGGGSVITGPPAHVIATILAASLAAATLGLSIAWRRLAVPPAAARAGRGRTPPAAAASVTAPASDIVAPTEDPGDPVDRAVGRPGGPLPWPPSARTRLEPRDPAADHRAAGVAPPPRPGSRDASGEPVGEAGSTAATLAPLAPRPVGPAAGEVVARPPERPIARPSRAAAVGAGATAADVAGALPADALACAPGSSPPIAPLAPSIDRQGVPARDDAAAVAPRYHRGNPWSRPAGGSPTIVAAPEAEPAVAARGSLAGQGDVGAPVSGRTLAAERPLPGPAGDAPDRAMPVRDRDEPRAARGTVTAPGDRAPAAAVAHPLADARAETAALDRTAIAVPREAPAGSAEQRIPGGGDVATARASARVGDPGGLVPAPDRSAPVAPRRSGPSPTMLEPAKTDGAREPGPAPVPAAEAHVRTDELVMLAASLVRRTASTADPASRAELAGLVEALLRRIIPASGTAAARTGSPPPTAELG